MSKKSSNPRNDTNGSICSTVKTISNEQILNEMHKMYVNPLNGLLAIGKKLGLHLFAPRRKVNIMLMGNHSSGKSSFINWYVNSKVQKTGVAIETQGFSFVTCGKHRETLAGKATLHLYPYLKPIESIKGVVQYLNTELVPSKSRRFNLVTFIDTPGLADGELYYPYDIEKAILWLGETVDLIFVFFDPIGQALCKRTLNLIEKLTNYHSERMRFFLTKADEAGDESDRQKVMMQIVQELCKRPGLNQCGFEMSTIYIPDHYNLKIRDKMCVNQIEDTCAEVEKTIALTIQNTFNQIEKDINQLEELAENQQLLCNNNFHTNMKNYLKLFLIFLFCIQFPISVWFYQLNMSSALYYNIDKLYLPTDSFLFRGITVYLNFIAKLLVAIFSSQNAFLFSLLILIPILFIAKLFIKFHKTPGLSKMNEINQIIQKLKDDRVQREKLLSSYLNQMVYEEDL